MEAGCNAATRESRCTRQGREKGHMSGAVIFGPGCGMIILSVVLLAVNVVYQKTAGKRIRKELEREYD